MSAPARGLKGPIEVRKATQPPENGAQKTLLGARIRGDSGNERGTTLFFSYSDFP